MLLNWKARLEPNFAVFEAGLLQILNDSLHYSWTIP